MADRLFGVSMRVLLTYRNCKLCCDGERFRFGDRFRPGGERSRDDDGRSKYVGGRSGDGRERSRDDGDISKFVGGRFRDSGERSRDDGERSRYVGGRSGAGRRSRNLERYRDGQRSKFLSSSVK